MLGPGSIFLPERRWLVRRDLLKGDSWRLQLLSIGPAVPFLLLYPALPRPSGISFSSSPLCCCPTCFLGQDVPCSPHIYSSSSLSPLCPHHRCLLPSRAGTRRKAHTVSSAICPGGTGSISGPSSTYGASVSGSSETLSCGLPAAQCLLSIRSV